MRNEPDVKLRRKRIG